MPFDYKKMTMDRNGFQCLRVESFSLYISFSSLITFGRDREARRSRDIADQTIHSPYST